MKTQHEIIREIMQGRSRWTPIDLQWAYEAATGKWLLDSTLTRRLREMKDVVCERKIVNGKQRWEYRLENTEQRAA